MWVTPEALNGGDAERLLRVGKSPHHKGAREAIETRKDWSRSSTISESGRVTWATSGCVPDSVQPFLRWLDSGQQRAQQIPTPKHEVRVFVLSSSPLPCRSWFVGGAVSRGVGSRQRVRRWRPTLPPQGGTGVEGRGVGFQTQQGSAVAVMKPGRCTDVGAARAQNEAR